MTSDVSGTLSDSLSGKLIVVGVTGSIAAVRAVDLIRSLIRRGAEVRCVMSPAAQKILHPQALEYASSNAVITEITGKVEHVELCGDNGSADLLLIAPATANTIGKMAHGIDDTPVTTFATTALGSRKPVMVVPAMHQAMYRHPAVIRNLEALQAMGVVLVDPKVEEGKAKIADPERVVLETERLLGRRDLAGKRILVTSGSSAERIDPIRILTNRSSGRTGTEIALEAYRRGAEVAIVHRFMQDLPFAEIYAESAQEMLEAVMLELPKGYNVLISAAAIADYTLDPAEEKIKSGQELTLVLRPTRKLLKAVRSAYPDLKLVGFKAETGVSGEVLEKRAMDSMRSYGLDLVVANDVGEGGIGQKDNRVLIIDSLGRKAAAEGEKRLIARRIVDAVAEIV
jgi:phosphopantothenoylcysteine decarboxylase/phosphopantothenate--cysteine ligase